jgi:hypothetical protein
MKTLDSKPSNNGRGSDAWSRPWTHLGIDRRGAGYCRVTFDHAPMNVTGATVCIPLHPPRMTLAQDLDRRSNACDRSAIPGRRRHPVRMIRGQTPVG